jgi:two-component system, OmpR family, aerobic respiration control sensor histidine kinase ArcB
LNKDSFLSLLSLVKSLPGIIYWKNKEGEYLGCNDTMLEISGMKSIVGKTDFDMPWAASAQILRHNDLKVMMLNSSAEIEESLTIANQQQVIILTKRSPLLDANGIINGVIGTSLNITSLKKQEFDILLMQEKTQSTLENIVAHMPGHVYWKDINGIYLGCNNRQARSLGFQYGYEILGKTDFDLPWGENKAELFRSNDRHIISAGETEIIEEKSQVDGNDAIVLSHKSPMRNKEGEITGILGISIDISDRKKIEDELKIAKEQAEAASLAKTEFLENMRHDIRTPLSGIIGFSDIIKSEAKNKQIKEYADNLVASSHALLSLMDEVLEAIRVSSGEIPRVKKKFALKSILQHVIELNMAKASSKSLELLLEADENIPKYLLGDNIRIHRVILELLSNALNFTDLGFVKLTSKLATLKGRDVIIKLIVEDSGMGIPKNKQQEIFLQFKRLTPSYKGIYKGAGLGLAIIKQFMDELDGEIYVDSEMGKGTVFTCIIPLKKSLIEEDIGLSDDFEINNLISKSSDITKNIKKLAGKTKNTLKQPLLVVEDNTIAQLVAKTILSKFNYQVDIASNGQEAISLWEKNKYDLIFMDIGLPDMDGYQVTQYIRSQEIGKNHLVPIIALTAHIGDENKQRCIECGMNAVISKPLTQKNCNGILDSFILDREKEKGAVTSNRDLPTKDELLFEVKNHPILDVAEGVKTTGTEEVLCEMLQFMIEKSLPEDFAMLKDAHNMDDWKKTQQVVHRIKGGVLYVGAIRIKVACQYLESYWKAGHRDLLEKLYQQLVQVIDDSIVEIKLWVGKK